MEYIAQEFEQRQWTLYQDNTNERVYRRKDTEFFIIGKSRRGNISVSFPMKNSDCNYLTEFENYSDVYDYVTNKLNYLDE
jgi:hypothetical protein